MTNSYPPSSLLCRTLIAVVSLTSANLAFAHGSEHSAVPNVVAEQMAEQLQEQGVLTDHALAAGEHDTAQTQTSSTIHSDAVATEPVYAELVREAPVPELNPSVGGAWSAVYDWPLVAVHAALLPNGKVLAWDATPDDSDDDPHTTDNYTTRVTLWDPINNSHVQTNNDTDTDLFCAGSAHLWDGRILFAGGDGARAGANGPLANSNIYNPVTNTWHRTQNMNAPRWYSSVAALSNGEMLTLGGTYEPTPLGEVFQFDQTWRPLSGNYPLTLTGDYQWLQQTPEGSVLSFGPSNLLLDIDTANNGVYTPQNTRDAVENRDYGSYAMFDVGKILVAGGAQGLASAVIIDTATRQTVDTNSLNHGRRQHNLTILADGSVLATGGNSDGAEFYSPTAKVSQPEIWNPVTQSWTVQNTMPTDRQYHSIAMLLPDGQVLSAGGGICGDCYRLGYEERNAEIFSPPYLFNEDGSLASRPRVGSVPSVANYSESFFISLDHDRDIKKAHLIKIGSVTHSENQDQRLVPIAFENATRKLKLTMPASRHIAPPGHYLLYVVDSAGVPSVGAMLKLGQPLVGSNQRIKATLELNTWDTYLTKATTGTTQVALSAANGTRVYLSADAPVRVANQDNVLCTAEVVDTTDAVCQVDVPVGSQLHISVNGPNRSEYALTYRDTINPANPVNTATVPTVTQPTSVPGNTSSGNSELSGTLSAELSTPADGLNTVRTGVGSTAHFFLLVLLFSGLVRPKTGRKGRV